MTSKTPSDLAKIVVRQLKANYGYRVSINVLNELFQILFLSSITEEEGRCTSCQIIYLNPQKPDPSPPPLIRRDRWGYVPLKRPVRFTVENLAKISHATDPRSSSLVVYPDSKGNLIVWGFVDQMLDFYNFIRHDSDSGPERPGVFQASVTDRGFITVHKDYRRLAELKVSEVVTTSFKILNEKGVILEKLQSAIRGHIRAIQKKVGGEMSPRENGLAFRVWINSLARILLRVQQFGHGGAVLVTDAPHLDRLHLKYRIKYRRLRSALESYCEVQIRRIRIRDQLMKERHAKLPRERELVRLYRSLKRLEIKVEDSRDEIEGCIWFISLLSRVDGAIVMSKRFEIVGFGTEITTQKVPKKIYQSESLGGERGSLRKLAYSKYGTRHRSMMRYVAKDVLCIGFIISQDGNVRAVTNVKGRILLWPDVDLRLDAFVDPQNQ